jgi:putative intracellular protease/amidase
VDIALEQANPEDYDALLLPGGVANPDQLRTQPRAVQFVKSFFDAGKPVAAICHGPWTLIEAGVVSGRAKVRGLVRFQYNCCVNSNWPSPYIPLPKLGEELEANFATSLDTKNGVRSLVF